MPTLLEAKNIFSNRLKRNRKICEAWQHYTQNDLDKFTSPSQCTGAAQSTVSSQDALRNSRFALLASRRSFTFAFLLPDNPSVVTAWHWTSEITLVMCWEKRTCFPSSSRARDDPEARSLQSKRSNLQLHIVIPTLDLKSKNAGFCSRERSGHARRIVQPSKSITRTSRQKARANNMTGSFNRTLSEVPKTF